MANVDNPHGFRPLMRSVVGGPGAGLELLTKAATYTALYIFDVVNQLSDTTLSHTTANASVLPSGVNLNYGQTLTLTKHSVITDPYAVFEAQGDGSGSLNQADEGILANVALGTGDSHTLISGDEILESTKNTTNTFDLKLLKQFGDPNNVDGAHGRFEVCFNVHRRLPGSTGV